MKEEMSKEEKIRKIIKIRENELNFMDKDTTKLTFILLGAWGAFALTLYNLGQLNDARAFWFLLVAIISIIWMGQQVSNFISDCYDWLVLTIKKNKIFNESLPVMKWYDSIYYTKKYFIEKREK